MASLDSLIYCELKKHVHRQNGAGRCGIAVVRSLLDYQFGINHKEEITVEELGDYAFYKKKNITKRNILKYLNEDRIKKYELKENEELLPEQLTDLDRKLVLLKKHGVPPTVMARYIRQKAGEDISIISSKNGNAEQLDQLIKQAWPTKIISIIHQVGLYPSEEDPEILEPDGHYMLFCGLSNSGKTVRIFDPSKVGGGFKTLLLETYNQQWADNPYHEKWFLLALLPKINVNKEFSGRYLPFSNHISALTTTPVSHPSAPEQ